MQSWDVAAGEIVAREAGATVSGPEADNDELMVVSAPGIHAELRSMVA